MESPINRERIVEISKTIKNLISPATRFGLFILHDDGGCDLVSNKISLNDLKQFIDNALSRPADVKEKLYELCDCPSCVEKNKNNISRTE